MGRKPMCNPDGDSALVAWSLRCGRKGDRPERRTWLRVSAVSRTCIIFRADECQDIRYEVVSSEA